MSSMQDRALAYLERDRLFNIDIIEAIRHYSAEILCVLDDGLLVHEKTGDARMITAESEETGLALLQKAGPAPIYAVHQDFLARQVETLYGRTHATTCHQAAYLSDAPLPLPRLPFAIRTAAPDDAAAIAAAYSHNTGDAYILDRVASGEEFAAYDGPALAGFIGLHAEGSMGMLEVLPEYRRRGLGEALMAWLVNYQLARGYAPFSQIGKTNDASYRLHEKLGFSISGQVLYWIE